MVNYIADKQFLRSVDDYRGSMEEYSDPRQWRIFLRSKLFKDRKGKSDLSGQSIKYSFDMHEGLFSRRWVGIQSFQGLLMAGPNCFLLKMEEHRDIPPSRAICYWLAVLNYGKERVDWWIDSLPFKSKPSMPWRGTCGLDIIPASRLQGITNAQYKELDQEA